VAVIDQYSKVSARDEREGRSGDLPFTHILIAPTALKKWDRHPTCCGLANRITQHIGSQSHFFNSLLLPGGAIDYVRLIIAPPILY
jgi:hypothetical protein